MEDNPAGEPYLGFPDNSKPMRAAWRAVRQSCYLPVLENVVYIGLEPSARLSVTTRTRQQTTMKR